MVNTEKEKKRNGEKGQVAIAIATLTQLEKAKHTTPHCRAVHRRTHIDLGILRPV